MWIPEGGQRRGRWPWWVGTSGLVHALLLGALAILAGVGESPPASLRVRLITESPEAPPLSAPRAAPARATRPVPPSPAMAHPAGVPPHPPGGEGLTIPSFRMHAGPTPEGPRPSSDPAGRRRDFPEASVATSPPGPMGEGRGPSTSPQAGFVELPTQTDLSPPASRLEAKAQGVGLVPADAGAGTGRVGPGAGDRGKGVGGGGMAPDGRHGSGESGGVPGNAGSGGPGSGLASRGGAGGRVGDGIPDLLRAIRRGIEQAKTYPDAARRAGIQGTVEVRFRIGPGGAAEGIEIVRSSGSRDLDEVSVQTIRRAGPYPQVSGRIRVPLSYRLDQ